VVAKNINLSAKQDGFAVIRLCGGKKYNPFCETRWRSNVMTHTQKSCVMTHKKSTISGPFEQNKVLRTRPLGQKHQGAQL
jgi:hypothetical protein